MSPIDGFTLDAPERSDWSLKTLVGSGGRIDAVVLPFLVVGSILNILYPSLFAVGGPPQFLKVLSLAFLIPGMTNWFWSAVLILRDVPRHRLITTGPYAIVKHPLYTGVALLVLPWAGFLLDTWLGLLLGIVLYAASRRYSPDEEKVLRERFGATWESYASKVMFPRI